MQAIKGNARNTGNGRVVMLVLLGMLVVGVLIYRAFGPGGGGTGVPERALASARDLGAERERQAVQPLGWRHRFGLSRTNAEVSAEAVVAKQVERYARSRRALAERDGRRTR